MAAGRTGVQEPSFLKPRSVILAFSLLVLLSTHTLADPALFAYRLEDVSKSTENGVFVVGSEWVLVCVCLYVCSFVVLSCVVY